MIGSGWLRPSPYLMRGPRLVVNVPSRSTAGLLVLLDWLSLPGSADGLKKGHPVERLFQKAISAELLALETIVHAGHHQYRSARSSRIGMCADLAQ